MSLSFQELGEQVKAAREQMSLSQEALARATTPVLNRSVIAHLEQGLRLPPNDTLTQLCEHLRVPATFWKGFLDPDYRKRLEFEQALTELVGHVVTLRTHDTETVSIAEAAVLALFSTIQTSEQAFDALNSVLVFYDIRQCAWPFFQKYLGPDAIRSPEAFLARVRTYQQDAIRLFSTFDQAYETLNTSELDDILAVIAPKADDTYRHRAPWNSIETIPDSRLPDLGYISAERAKQEQGERQILATFLREMADKLTSDKTALQAISTKKKNKMSSLLRKFNSRIPHDFISPLFVPDADQLRREAEFLAPKEDEDLARMAETQATAMRNLGRYLAADHLDVYVATSMRSDADFISVNNFCVELFKHAVVEPLRLRHFNPTQSWIEDRVAKGLVEALMLKRSSMTLYMAQKTDTFGKDSEASVALGQGKPVIVYVPRLFIEDVLDTESLGQRSRSELEVMVAREGSDDDKESDETMDGQALLARLITIRIKALADDALARTVRTHWADFDLYGEAVRVPESDRGAYRAWLDSVIREGRSSAPSQAIRDHLISVLVATAITFERRARTFKEQHPLALQVILSTGVLNGILVTRSVESCAALVRALIRNEIDTELEVDSNNYRLLEKTTRSTIRVISRHTMIGNAFSAFYKRRPG